MPEPSPSTTKPELHVPVHPVRFVTATSLFDGHDAAINIMRRILQSQGAEVIHLGHNRSVDEVVTAAIQEDAQGVAVSSYQGGHLEYFGYLVDLLAERGVSHIKVFGGGGGVIVPAEIAELHARGVRIFSPHDGQRLGLPAMVNTMVAACDVDLAAEPPASLDGLLAGDERTLARVITVLEASRAPAGWAGEIAAAAQAHRAPVLGITGTGGSGKSSLTDELLRRVRLDTEDKLRVAVLAVDPTRRKGGGALLGDRIRMNAIEGGGTFVRSLATRGGATETPECLPAVIDACRAAGFDLVIVETPGIGQGDSAVVNLADVALYVMTPEFGASSQLEKIDMLDFADVVAINKFDRRGADDALRDVRRQLMRNQELFGVDLDTLPVYGTVAARFNDDGVTSLYQELRARLADHGLPVPAGGGALAPVATKVSTADTAIVPPKQVRYLADIADTVRRYHARVDEQAEAARRRQQLDAVLAMVEGRDAGTLSPLSVHFPLTGQRDGTQSGDGATGRQSDVGSRDAGDGEPPDAPGVSTRCARGANGGAPGEPRAATTPSSADANSLSVPISPTGLGKGTQSGGEPTSTDAAGHHSAAGTLSDLRAAADAELAADARALLDDWPGTAEAYRQPDLVSGSGTGDAARRTALERTSLSGSKIPRVALPRYHDHGDLLRWLMAENLPGRFPFTAGVFPFKRENEDPARMFAGEGGPARTNRRFHLLAEGQPATRLSTAFDSVTLYGYDPDERPDIYGKVGNAGVSIATLDDMKVLYGGFDLCDPTTSVSMTINGPAPTILAMFLNTVIDQRLERFEAEHGRPPTAEEAAEVRAWALSNVRGTVQADILKEDQGQNTCILSTEFALGMMADIAEWFVEHRVRNFYSVSISGYHIAEAGANPLTQLAFTLANGFTYVEAYLARGMAIDDFAPNLSFFFSNGMDPEYSVLGRVARRIWAVAMRDRYGAGERSQKLKYHVQTSGRSLHAQEMAFNDIRTTLQALIALYDNCNSLHTNAYDEAVTTPTTESVRRALAIQLIINREWGLSMNENPLQGSFIIEELTDLVERAVLDEFDRLAERGGVLGAMETGYQRGRIQDESMLYERRKHDGSLPLVGVNTFLVPDDDEAGYADGVGADQSAEGEGAVAASNGGGAAGAAAPHAAGGGSHEVAMSMADTASGANADHGVKGVRTLSRSTDAEKRDQIERLRAFQSAHAHERPAMLARLREAAMAGDNLFDVLMDAVRCCTLGEITHTLFEVGGRYRRNV